MDDSSVGQTALNTQQCMYALLPGLKTCHLAPFDNVNSLQNSSLLLSRKLLSLSQAKGNVDCKGTRFPQAAAAQCYQAC